MSLDLGIHGDLPTTWNRHAEENRQLGSLLKRATALRDSAEPTVYNEFRLGLLTHIGREEKLL
jgi:hypothetical protein